MSEMRYRKELARLQEVLAKQQSQVNKYRALYKKFSKKFYYSQKLLEKTMSTVSDLIKHIELLKEKCSLPIQREIFSTANFNSVGRKRAFNGIKKNDKIKYYRKKLLSNEKNNQSNYRERRKNIKEKVVSFYLNDENSRPTPSAHETVTKNKKKMQKRMLSDTVFNLHRIFCKELNIVISRALFYKLKPFWVVNQKLSSRATCLCVKCANFKFMLEKLHRLKIIEYNNPECFFKSVCCDVMGKQCMFRECNICKDLKVPANDSTEIISYAGWVSEEIERPGSKGLTYKVK